VQVDASNKAEVADCLAKASRGKVLILVQPGESFLSEVQIEMKETFLPRDGLLEGLQHPRSGLKLRSFHKCCTYKTANGLAMLTGPDGYAAWLYKSIGQGGLLILGTDLQADLIRYRQGDPDLEKNKPQDPQWGIAGERPTYLYEKQLQGFDAGARPADDWAYALAVTLSDVSGIPLQPILPDGAPGAIVITGDDDQAYLEKYDEQIQILKDLPITYLLHPLTRHTKKTIAALRRQNPRVDFGIHPDALDAPNRYNDLFIDQLKWYRSLVGDGPVSVRNHGFLNDGYWGHLQGWLDNDVRISSNIPGLDGQILNGSLLPARMVWRGRLTDHWSILTAIGDGIRFINGMSDSDAAKLVRQMADRVAESEIPGVIVLNLHPQNISETRAMHEELHNIVSEGFLAWNLRECLEWFLTREGDAFKRSPVSAYQRHQSLKTLRAYLGRIWRP
jgi:hypothetical protein